MKKCVFIWLFFLSNYVFCQRNIRVESQLIFRPNHTTWTQGSLRFDQPISKKYFMLGAVGMIGAAPLFVQFSNKLNQASKGLTIGLGLSRTVMEHGEIYLLSRYQTIRDRFVSSGNSSVTSVSNTTIEIGFNHALLRFGKKDNWALFGGIATGLNRHLMFLKQSTGQAMSEETRLWTPIMALNLGCKFNLSQNQK